MEIKITQAFKFAHRGVEIRDYETGEVVDADEELSSVALTEGWAEKAVSGAPENKDAAKLRKTK